MKPISKHTLFYFIIIALTASLTSGCKTDFLKPTGEKKPTQSTPVEIKETTKVVYVEVDPSKSVFSEFCTSQCSIDEINAQLNAFLSNPVPSHVYRWMDTIKRTQPQNLKEQIDNVNADQIGNNNTNLLSGIFFSLPKTGHRNTALAIKHLSDYAQISTNNINETTFLSVAINSLKERKYLIDERSQLRKQNALLQEQKEQYVAENSKLEDQLNKIKEIEHLMYKKQSQSRQFKVQK